MQTPIELSLNEEQIIEYDQVTTTGADLGWENNGRPLVSGESISFRYSDNDTKLTTANPGSHVLAIDPSLS